MKKPKTRRRRAKKQVGIFADLKIWFRRYKKWILVGVASLLLVVTTALLWMSVGDSDSSLYEADTRAHLGNYGEETPRIALPLISVEKVARHLNIATAEEALSNAKVFADRVASGFLPNAWDLRCREQQHPAMCLGLDEYFAPFLEKSSASSRRRRSTLPFRDSNLDRLQAEDLGQLLARVKKHNLRELRRWTKNILSYEDCPRNFSITLARKWEYHLKEKDAQESITALDKHGMECVGPDDPHFEYQLLRAALLQYSFGNLPTSLEYLDKATTVTLPREQYRIHFWRINILNELGEHKRATDLQESLMKLFPLSWQSIVLHKAAGRDPMQPILMQSVFGDQYFSGIKELDRRLSWFYLMLHVQAPEFAFQRYFEQILPMLNSEVPIGVFQHLARVLDRLGQHRYQIMALNRLFANHRDTINLETLRLYYPKPYFKEIDDSSPGIDTAVLLGLVRQESGFNPRAQSPVNARGLLQVLPSTAREVNRRVSAEDLFDSDINIRVGATYFMRLVRYFGGSVERSLAAYNAGMGRVRNWETQYGVLIKDEQVFMDMIPFRETREYVPSILRNAYWYHQLFPNIHEALVGGVKTSDLLRKQLNLDDEE